LKGHRSQSVEEVNEACIATHRNITR